MSLNENILLRPPKAFYYGRNGFIRPPTAPHEISSLSLALDEHKRALYVIEHKKRPVPDFEAMKAEVERADEAAALNERIQQLRTEHESDLDLLYDIHANDYLNEVMDWHASMAEFPSDDVEGKKTLEKLGGSFKIHQDWSNDDETLRYTYLSMFIPLKKRQKELEEKEAEMARRRAQMFPQSKEDFKTKPNEVKLRTARFLGADAAKKERMMAEFGWAWRQTKLLQDIFTKDDHFRAEIQGMILVADTQVRDPRKRTSIG